MKEFLLLPHHITPDILAREGERFDEEFSARPRPFIGINLVNYYGSPYDKESVKKIAAAAKSLAEASFFAISCSRASDESYNGFIRQLEKEIGVDETRFPIVGFNLNAHAERSGHGNFWNPYKGMLASADHIFQIGYSGSMVAEALAAGKVPYVDEPDKYDEGVRKGCVIDLTKHKIGEPLEARRVVTRDVTEECASHLAQALASHLEDISSGKKAAPRYIKYGYLGD